MIKRKLTTSDYLLLVANLLPVAGVWVWGWSPKEIFLVYCLETIIIGIFTLIKMGIVTVVRKKDTWYNQGSSTNKSGLFFMLFFLMHYGFFVAAQMGIFFGVSGIGDEYNVTLSSFFTKWPQMLSSDSLVLLGVFVFSYGFKMLYEFISSGEYKTVPLMLLMFQPYARIFIQQIVVILGSIFLSFGAGKVFILIFAMVKIFFELFVNYDGLLNKAMKDFKKDPTTNN